MPAMDAAVLEDVTQRLSAYLEGLPGYGAPAYLTSGGSAAVFRVATPHGDRVIKACDPKFLEGERGQAERRRLELQRRLIGHKCEGLVALHRVDESQATAFIEMEYVAWPQLKDVLSNVPDAEVASLVRQLVTVVRFLEAHEIVHRDIKPENIHISADFKQLKLLDLGVARELQLAEEEAVAATDHGGQRPFVATAQYSSPEYLFRLDQPSPTLWKGLSIYQVGAVLHDLIMKKPIFSTEVGLANRWLLARAVLTKEPSFADTDPKRLVDLKALAVRCLTKDLNSRLQLVDWADFANMGADSNPLAALRKMLSKGGGLGAQAAAANAARLEFDREQFEKRLREGVAFALIEVCGNRMPPLVSQFSPDAPHQFNVQFNVAENLLVMCIVHFEWLEALQNKSVNVMSAATIKKAAVAEPDNPERHLVCAGAIGDSEDLAVHQIACSIAKSLQLGLELLESKGNEADYIGSDLVCDAKAEEAKK